MRKINIVMNLHKDFQNDLFSLLYPRIFEFPPCFVSFLLRSKDFFATLKQFSGLTKAGEKSGLSKKIIDVNP